MNVWWGIVDVLAPAAGIVLLLVLGWAALERGQIHRRWAAERRRQTRGDSTAALVIDWCMAAGAAAGWV